MLQGYHTQMGKLRVRREKELGQVTQLQIRGRGEWTLKAWDS